MLPPTPGFWSRLVADSRPRWPSASHRAVLSSAALNFVPMPCNPDVLKNVPLFALLDDEESAVLAGQVELKTFAPRQRIYRMGETGGRAYVLVSGLVRVTTVDEDGQE